MEAFYLSCIQKRDPGPNPWHALAPFHESFSGELCDMNRFEDRSSPCAGSDETQQVSDRARSDRCCPISADKRVIRRESVVGVEGSRMYQSSGDHGGPEYRSGARVGWRDTHLDGRTIILMDGPGHRCSHARVISSNRKYVQGGSGQVAKT